MARRFSTRASFRRREAGLSIIEILIALFVFLVGVLGIFAVIPVAMQQSSFAVRTSRAITLAQLALANLTYELRTARALYEGSVASVTGTPPFTLRTAGAPNWQPRRWVGIPSGPEYYALGRHPIDGEVIGRITDNTADTLTIDTTTGWKKVSNPAAAGAPPSVGGYFRIVHYYAPPNAAVAAGGTTLSVAGTPWVNGQWKDTYAVIVSGPGVGQARRISDNTSNSLTVSKPWEADITILPWDPITTLSRFRIAAAAIDARNHENLREGAVASVNPTDKYKIVTDQTALAFDTANGRFFILITSGRAAGRVCELTAIDSGTTLVTLNTVDFIREGVRPGDTCCVIGNKTGVVSHPRKDFGVAGSGQTAPDPSFITKSDYSYIIIFSDAGNFFSKVDAPPVRADVLVFRNYDDAKTPAGNKRAVAFQTSFILPEP